MADGSKIEWCDATWQPITGCSVVSPGCANCYAMRLAGTRLRDHRSRAGLTRDTKAGPVWTGEVRLNEQWLDQPLKWWRARRIFVCAHGDLFAEGVPDEWIDRVFAVMALAPQHTFMVLTKLARRMRGYCSRHDVGLRWAFAARRSHISAADAVEWTRNGLPNLWLGVSVEDQARADERIPELLATPAAKRFISAEPLLGPVSLEELPIAGRRGTKDALTGEVSIYGNIVGDHGADPASALDWVIVGGESGPGARPMHPDWARSLRDQCADAGVPFFFKQWGGWLPDHQSSDPAPYAHAHIGHRFSDGLVAARVGKARAGRRLDGREHNEAPQ
jgi:protein gp37